MNTLPIYGLVCAGGGAHGAYQVGVLKYIHEKFSDGPKSPFRIFAGSSCGALNTSFYAAQSHDAMAGRLYLEELWKGFHIPEYHGNMTRNALLSLIRAWSKGKLTNRKSPWALLDPKPMQDVIRRGFETTNLQIAFEQKTTLGVAVSATELLSGRTCWFLDGPLATNWNVFHSIGITTQLKGHHIEASCSIPVFLPPVKIDGRYYLDGSVSLARPLSAAISMGATKILSIAADKPTSMDLPTYHKNYKPKLSHVIRMMINQLTHDRATDEAVQIEKLNQFHKSLNRKQQRTDLDAPTVPIYHEEHRPDDYRPIDLCLFFPSRRIRRSPAFTTYQSGSSKPRRTRFMFHQKFITELIDLGYEDAKSKHDELHKFFVREKSRDRRWFIFAK